MTDLQKRMDALYRRKVEGTLEIRVRRTALGLYGDLKILTPVDTGRARSNWHLDIGVPTVQLVEPGGDIAPSLSTYTIDQTIFISNNLPYIQRLNEGHSSQAPAGFVEDAVNNARSRI